MSSRTHNCPNNNDILGAIMSRTLAQVRRFTFAVFAFGMVCNAHAVVMEDQFLVTGTDTAAFVAAGTTFQQGVTAGKTGTLTRVDIQVADMFSMGQIDFFINLGPPWQVDSNDFETTIDIDTPGWITVPILVDINVVAEVTQFAVGLSGNTGVVAFVGSLAGNAYTRGSLFRQIGSSDVEELDQADINFRTFVDVSSMPPPAGIPEPGGLLLLAMGLAGLAFTRSPRQIAV
jgi:hypothetical protein